MNILYNCECHWSMHAADALHGLQLVHSLGPTSCKGSDSSGSEGGNICMSDNRHGSTTFFTYVILVVSPEPSLFALLF